MSRELCIHGVLAEDDCKECQNEMATAKNIIPIGDSSPGLLLRRLVDMEDDIEHVMVVVQMKDGATETYFTRMKNSDMTWFVWNIQAQVSKVLELGEI